MTKCPDCGSSPLLEMSSEVGREQYRCSNCGWENRQRPEAIEHGTKCFNRHNDISASDRLLWLGRR